jgi:hypothetical protein
MPKGEDRMTTMDDSANQLARLLLTSLIEIRHTQGADQGRPAVVVKSDPIGAPGKELRTEQAGSGDVETRPGDEADPTNGCQSEITIADGDSRLQASPVACPAD